MNNDNGRKVADDLSATATKTKRLSTQKRRNGLMAAVRGSKTKDVFQFANEAYFARVQGQKAPKRVKDPKTGKIKTERTGGRKSSARYIIGELIRAAEEYMHGIPSPMAPNHLWGIEPDQLMDWYEEMRKKAVKGVEEYTSCKGKRCFRPQRESAVIMIGAVFSFPGLPDDSNPQFVQWQSGTLEWITRKYGDKLISVISHDDENYGHIHAIAADDGKPVKHLTCGNREAWAAEAAGATGNAITDAYKAGCTAWQDDYFKAVCEPLGMKRKGSKKQYHKPLNEARTAAFETKEQELLDDADAVLRMKKLQEDEQITLELAEAELNKIRIEGKKSIDAANAAHRQADFELQRRDIRLTAKEEDAHAEAKRLIAAAMAQAAAIISNAEKASSEFLAASREQSGSKQLARALEAALNTLDGEQRFLATSAAQKAFRGVVQPSKKM